MKNRWKLGDKTKEIWSGDLISECEFISEIGEGRMIFYDIDMKCFRLVFIEGDEDGHYNMNGWKCAKTISELL